MQRLNAVIPEKDLPPVGWETQVPLFMQGDEGARDHVKAHGEKRMLIDGHIVVMDVEVDQEGGVDLKFDASCEVARKSRRSAASSSNELMEQAITLIRFLISLIHQNVGTEYCGSY